MKKLLLIVMIVGFYACELEQEPIVEITEQDLFADPDNIEALVLDAYRPMGYEYIGDLTGQDTYVLPFIYTDIIK